jgi:hypothetical protein
LTEIKLQEPDSKPGIDFKKLSEEDEIHESKSKPQSSKSIKNLSKSLDKSNISNIPKPQKPVMRKHSTLLKQVSSKEKTATNPLG